MWRRSCYLRFSKLHLAATKLRSGLGFLGRSFSEAPRSGKRFAALWGNGDYGRLGLGNLDSRWSPAICDAFRDKTLKSIACGGAHTLFLTGSSSFLLSLSNWFRFWIQDRENWIIYWLIYGLLVGCRFMDSERIAILGNTMKCNKFHVC